MQDTHDTEKSIESKDNKEIPTIPKDILKPLVTPQERVTKQVNILKALSALNPPPDQRWSLVAYFLLQKPVDGNHGIFFEIASFPSKEMANERKEILQRMLNTNDLRVIQNCQPYNLSEREDSAFPILVDINDENSVQMKKFKEQQAYYAEMDKKKRIMEEEMTRNHHLREQSDTIEHYIYNYYAAIHNYKIMREHEKLHNEAKEAFYSKAVAIREQYQKQPQFEQQWKNAYFQRLREQGNQQMATMIEQSSDLVSDIIFGVPLHGINGIVESEYKNKSNIQPEEFEKRRKEALHYVEVEKKKYQEQLALAAAAEAERKRKEEELAAIVEKERLLREKERLEREKEQLEKERLEKLEKERLERERLEKLEKDRLEKERLEKERLEKEKLERERLEEKRLQKEKKRKEREVIREKRRLMIDQQIQKLQEQMLQLQKVNIEIDQEEEGDSSDENEE